MIISDNISTQLGDVIIFKTVPLFRILELKTFNDNITGITDTRFFKKEVCYSFNAIVFSEYKPIEKATFDEINSLIKENDIVVLKFRYERIGTDNSGQLIINFLNIDATYNTTYNPNYETSKRTPFSELVYDNIDVWNLAFNLAEKMYVEGIVPAYLVRGEESDNIFADKDYIDYWEVVAKLFGIVLIDSFKFTVIYFRKELLCEYLKQKDIIVCECENLVILQSIAKRYFDEFRQRGTLQIFRPKGYEYQIGDRFIYESPYEPFENIRPSLPVAIDGNFYSEVDDLPEGWVWLKGEDIDNEHGLLVAPDKNFHDIIFLDTNNLEIQPLSTEILLSSLSSKIVKKYNGEYLRLICYKELDEFIINIPERKYTGWSLGNSSPLYKGLRPQYNKMILKVYESWQ